MSRREKLQRAREALEKIAAALDDDRIGEAGMLTLAALADRQKNQTKTEVAKLQDAAVDLLCAEGWMVAVIGEVSIERENPFLLNHRLVVRFTGVLRSVRAEAN